MMQISKSSNPALKENIFQRDYSMSSDVMTINGTINKTALSLLLVIAAALFTWNKFFNAVTPEAGMSAVMPWMAIGGIGGFITAIVTVFRPKSAGISTPIYAVLEGMLLGGLSAILEASY